MGNNAIQELGGQNASLSSYDILMLHRFQDSIFPLCYCSTMLKNAMRANPVQIYFKQKHQVCTPKFRAVLDKYWSKFASDATATLNALGVIPITFLVTHDGFKIPHVLVPGTYNLRWRHSILSEGLTFDVTRTTASGISFFNTHTNANDVNGQDILSSNQMAGLLNGDSTTLGSLTKNASDQLITGPTVGDPNELLTRRADMGRSIPDMGQPDPSCIVLSGFGTDPSVDGCLKSKAATLWPEYIKLMMHEHMNIAQEDRVTSHVPFGETPEPSKEYVESLTTDMMGPTTLSQAMGANNGVQRVMLSQQDISQRILFQKAHNQVNAQNQVASLNLPILENMLQMKPHQSYEALKAYIRQTHLDETGENMLNRYELLQPGLRLSSYAPHVSSVHLPKFIDLFHLKACAQYQIPMSAIAERATTQGDSTQQREAKYEAVHWHIQTISNIMTDIYQSLYSANEVRDALSYLHDRFLSKDAVGRLLKDFDESASYEALQQVLRTDRLISYSNRYTTTSKRPVWVHEGDNYTLEFDQTASGKRKAAAIEKDNKRLNKRKRTKRDSSSTATIDDEDAHSNSDSDEEEFMDPQELAEQRVERRIDWLSRWLHNPDDAVLLSDSIKDILTEPDYDLARLRLKLMYFNNLRSLANSDKIQLFLEGDQNQQAWFTKKTEKLEKQAEALRDVRVTIIYGAPIELPELTFMGMMGLINDHEYSMMARSRHMLPVQCDTKESQKQMQMLGKLSKFMASSAVQQMVAKTPMGTMMKAVEGELTKEQQKLEGENEQLQSKLKEEQKSREVDKAVAKVTKQLEKKAESTKPSSTSSASTTSSSPAASSSSPSSSSSSSDSKSSVSKKETSSSEKPTTKSSKKSSGSSKAPKD